MLHLLLLLLLLLLLRLLLLLLLLLLYRGPAQPDTTRATGQSTEGRGGQLLGLLLLTSSVSIPGELHMLPLLMLRSLLLVILGASPGRLRTEHPAKVLNRPCPAEGSRPGEVAAEVDKLGKVVSGKPLLGDCPIHFCDEGGLPGFDGCRGSLCSLPLLDLASFLCDDASHAIRFIVGAIIVKGSRHGPRP